MFVFETGSYVSSGWFQTSCGLEADLELATLSLYFQVPGDRYAIGCLGFLHLGYCGSSCGEHRSINIFFKILILILLDPFPEMRLLDHMAILFLIFFEELQTVSHSGWAILHFQRWHWRLPVSLRGADFLLTS